MKYLMLVLIAAVMASCGVCDQSDYYQIKKKYPDGNSTVFCQYEVNGIGTCATWQQTEVLYFTDSCSKFPLSKILTRAQVHSYSTKKSPSPN